MVLKSRLGLNKKQSPWEKLMASLRGSKSSLPLVDENTIPSLVGQDYFRQHAWTFPIEITGLFSECMSLKALPDGVRPSLFLLKCSIEMHNFKLMHSILLSVEAHKRQSWQKAILPALIQKGSTSNDYIDLIVEWAKALPQDTKIMQNECSILYAAFFYQSERIAQRLVDLVYEKDYLPHDIEKVLSLSFLLSRLANNPLLRKTWAELFNILFKKLPEEKSIGLLTDCKALLLHNWKAIKAFRAKCNFDELIVNTNNPFKKPPFVALKSHFLTPFEGVIRLDAASKEKAQEKIPSKFWLDIITKDFVNIVKHKKDALESSYISHLAKEVQFANVILEGNIKEIEDLIQKEGMQLNLESLAWLFIRFSRLNLSDKESMHLDQGVHYIFVKFPHLVKIIRFPYIIACATLHLFKTLEYIASDWEISDIGKYIVEEFSKKSKVKSDHFMEVLVSCALEKKQFWILHYFKSHTRVVSLIQKKLVNSWHALENPLPLIKYLHTYNLKYLFTDAYWEALFSQYLKNDLVKLQDKINVLQFILDKKLLKITTAFSMCNYLEQKDWLYQLIVFDRWLLSKGAYSHFARKEYNSYLENGINAIVVKDKASARDLLLFLYGLFSFKVYPGLFGIMDAKRQQSVFKKLFFKVMMFIHKVLLTENTQEIAFSSLNNLHKPPVVHYIAEKDVKICIGGYSTVCAFDAAKWYLETFGNILLTQQIVKECLEARKQHPLYLACMEYLESNKQYLKQSLTKEGQQNMESVRCNERIELIKALLQEKQPRLKGLSFIPR